MVAFSLPYFFITCIPFALCFPLVLNLQHGCSFSSYFFSTCIPFGALLSLTHQLATRLQYPFPISFNVSPHSNNAYKHAAPPGTIHVSIKGGAFPMPQQKLTIVPVTLHTENENNSATKPTVLSSNPTCTIKTANAEISFFNGVDEHIIQAVMRELKNG
jgi:hypothetical protein